MNVSDSKSLDSVALIGAAVWTIGYVMWLSAANETTIVQTACEANALANNHLTDIQPDARRYEADATGNLADGTPVTFSIDKKTGVLTVSIPNSGSDQPMPFPTRDEINQKNAVQKQIAVNCGPK